MTARMLEQLAHGENVSKKSPVERLSDRELEVYRMYGEGFGTREIANALHLSIKTIESYRENIKEKLHLSSGNEMICHAAQWVEDQV